MLIVDLLYGLIRPSCIYHKGEENLHDCPSIAFDR
jgi:hypothetical protein